MRKPALALLALVGFAQAAAASPLTPDAALAAFQCDAGLTVELVAAEPLVGSPCALAWDDAGRLFVVENRGYPTGAPDSRPAGVIALLEDADGDGRLDRRTVFADGLTFPNGLLAWDGGFFVTCAPDVFFLKDTDGDGRADVRRVVLTGFDTSNSTQLRVAHPTLGPDGWIYLTSGLTRAGQITSPAHPDRPAVKISTDARFDPFTFEIEPVDGRGQFGQTFDDWGNRFICMNRVHIQHPVLPSRVLQRNPDFAFAETVQDVPEGMVNDLLKGRNAAARIYPISDNLTTADSHAGFFSAACSVQIYRGDALPVDYYGDVFVCDPTGNLVHRDRLTAVGPTFSSRMVNEGREFLASRDNWFRPVYLATGPDGALYVADMYRRTIEHPDYLPEEVRRRTDFADGRELGRIWRISAVERGNRRALESIEGAGSAASLARDLAHPNVWQRERAQRILLAGRMTNAVPLLLENLPKVAISNQTDYVRAAAREADSTRRDLAAVATVNALNAVGALVRFEVRSLGRDQVRPLADGAGKELFQRVLAATADRSPGVRSVAWRSLQKLGPLGPSVAHETMRSWSNDPNAGVRFQIALALGNWGSDAATRALIEIGFRDGADKWARAAFFSGLKGRTAALVDFHRPIGSAPPAPELGYELGRYVGPLFRDHVRDAGVTIPLSATWSIADSTWEMASLAGYIDGLGLIELPTPGDFKLKRLGYTDAALVEIRRQARRLLQSNGVPLLVQRAAATVLALADADAGANLLELLRSDPAPELARHVLALVIATGSPTALAALLSPAAWAEFTPALQASLVESLLRREDTSARLLDAIEAGAIPPTAVALAQRDRLRAHQAEALRGRAQTLFAAVGGDRMKAYEALKDVAQQPGNAASGRTLFRLHCASCHRLDREGHNVGPDLFGVRNQTKEAILLHLVVPNLEVYPGFAAVDIEMLDARSLTGIVAAENEQALTLRMAQGLEESLRRADIKTRRTATMSLMPEGFDQVLTRAELADLLAFLRGEPESTP